MVPNHQPVWVYMGSSSYKSLNIIHQPTITNHCQPLLTITQHTWLLPHMYRKQCFFLVTNVMGGGAGPGSSCSSQPAGFLARDHGVWANHTAQVALSAFIWEPHLWRHWWLIPKKTAKLKQRRFVSLQLSVSLDATMFRSLDSDWCQNWRRRNS